MGISVSVLTYLLHLWLPGIHPALLWFLLFLASFPVTILILNTAESLAHPARAIAAPNAHSDDPINELVLLAQRSSARLRVSYRLHLGFAVAVMLALMALLGGSAYLVWQEKVGYAALFGGTGVGGLVLTRWKWQPFTKVTQALKNAEAADVMAVGLRLRIRSIEEVKNPKQRSEAQWKAVKEYTELLLGREG